ncbi:rmlC-like jelly roll fold protein [Artemisia annua]|uniref:RmlC-like jelly roll fold protein n=1 Tax=Artemisia annua TaxID=35608 RepID=A0A2U1LGM1_ARTAN|nr:rmlC-like jelly roll fold protein [Artemisia annua]
MRNTSLTILFLVLYACFASLSLHGDEEGGGGVLTVVQGKHGTVVKKDDRMSVVSVENGEISSVKISDGKDGFYHLQFITMEPNSLFLPVHLHSDMVFYVQSGNGTLSWVDLRKDDDKLRQVDLRTGDVYRLTTGSFFYIQSSLESDRRKLRINAIFSDSREEIREGSTYGAYSSVRDLVLGFDSAVLQAALNVDKGAIQELKSSERQPPIVHGMGMGMVENLLEVHYRTVMAFMGRMKNGMIDGMIDMNKKKDKKKKDKAYNILDAKHDVENCNGWSLVVTSKQLDAFKDSDFGIFMVNLTKGSMMGPHWNPMTAEIAVVLNGRGMVHVVCPSTLDETECKNSRFRVEEGDVFVVPRYHPMAQISFNNGSFVFMGFTTTQKNNHPQYLVGTASVFQALDKNVMAASLGVSNTTMDKILSAQREAIILQCTSCAEEEERLMEEEIQRQEEAERKREEEDAKKREEERRKKEEEEEAKRQEEAAKREQEEARKKEEEEAKRREEEKRRQEEEEEARKQREEEEAARQEQEAERRQEEEARQQKQQEEAAARRRQQEEEEASREEEAAAARRRQQEEEAARQRQQDDEAARRRQQEEEAARQEQQRQQEEAARRQQQEEEAARQQEARRREEEAARQQRQREEEARRRQQKEEAARGGGSGGRGGGGRRGGGEGEAASREEEEMAQRQREAEEAARGRGRGGESYEE